MLCSNKPYIQYTVDYNSRLLVGFKKKLLYIDNNLIPVITCILYKIPCNINTVLYLRKYSIKLIAASSYRSIRIGIYMGIDKGIDNYDSNAERLQKLQYIAMCTGVCVTVRSGANKDC